MKKGVSFVAVPVRVSVATIATIANNITYGGFAKLGNQICFIDGYPEDRDCDNYDYYGLLVYEVPDLDDYTECIRLPFTEEPDGMAACEQSNSIYIWVPSTDALRLVPDGNGGFEMLHWPAFSLPNNFLGCSRTTDNSHCINSFSVLDDGNLLVKRCVIPKEHVQMRLGQRIEEEIVLSVHKPDGSVIRNIELPLICHSSNVVMKSNGNFVYVLLRDNIVIEVDQARREIVRYSPRINRYSELSFAPDRLFLDSYDRVILLENHSFDLCVLDTELNFLEYVHVEPTGLRFDNSNFSRASFYKESSEMIIQTSDGCIIFIKLTL